MRGLVQCEWQKVALHELTARTFVLNFQGAKAAIDAELSTCYIRAAWQVLWIFSEDYGLKPDEIETECDGLSAGDFAHVPYETNDHEAAHLLHYLKPEHNGLHVRTGQERFVDVEFRHRDRQSRISFAEKMQEDAFSFPTGHIEEVAALVLAAARARNGWRVIHEASVIHEIRRHVKTVGR